MKRAPGVVSENLGGHHLLNTIEYFQCIKEACSKLGKCKYLVGTLIIPWL